MLLIIRTRVRLVECPECQGVRRDDDRLCPTCEGDGEVSRDKADAYLEGLNRGRCSDAA
jgi:DnaJ-class molecular chaperone